MQMPLTPGHDAPRPRPGGVCDAGINIATAAKGWQAMDTQAPDDDAGDSDAPTYRERAASVLDQIARDAKEALAHQDIDLFFLVPNSGDAILIYGTPADPDDASWERVGVVVSAIVGRLIGLRGTRRRPVQCATTHDQA
jgi:hypothetical protein